jgi:hypothetical protein
MEELNYELIGDMRLINMKQYYSDYCQILVSPEHEETLGSLLEEVIEGAVEALDGACTPTQLGISFDISRFGVQTPPHNFKFEIYPDGAHNLTIYYVGCQTDFSDDLEDE